MIGSGTPASAATGVDQPAVALRTTLAGDVALVRLDALHPAVLDVEARHLDALVDLDAAPPGLLGVAPDDGVVADDPAGRVVERALDRPGHVLADVDLRAELLHLVAVDHAAVDPEQLVHLGALVLHDERAVGVREREVAVLREHHVEVEVGGELLVELDALLVERGALRRAVVRADDRRVAAGGARADVALLEDRDVGDAVVDREVVRGREAVRAAADDDDVVVLLQRPGALEDLLAEEDVLHARAPRERVDADGPAAERRGAVDRDLPDVLAELLGAEHPVAALALEDVALDVGDLAARREVVDVRQPAQHRVGLGADDRDHRVGAGDVEREAVADLRRAPRRRAPGQAEHERAAGEIAYQMIALALDRLARGPELELRQVRDVGDPDGGVLLLARDRDGRRASRRAPRTWRRGRAARARSPRRRPGGCRRGRRRHRRRGRQGAHDFTFSPAGS